MKAIEDVSSLIRVALEDISGTFDIKENLYETYIGEIIDNKELAEAVNNRQQIDDWHDSTPLGGPGTILNAVVLYCLIRHYGVESVLETGVSGGFYTAFMLAASIKNKDTRLTSVELSDDENLVGSLIPFKLKKYPLWNLNIGSDSLKYMRENKVDEYRMYCHDSLHTVAHMTKELMRFKMCKLDTFIVYIDDQITDNFWTKSLQTNLFKKPGYDVVYISGAESRLKGHLGGFLKYSKR